MKFDALLPSLLVLFIYLFYPLGYGLNVFAFDAVLLLSLLHRRPMLGRQPMFVVATAGLLASALAVVIVHGAASVLAHHLSFLLLLGYAQRRGLRFVFYALLLGCSSVVCAPRRLRIRLYRSAARWRLPTGWGGSVLLTVAVLVPFYVLYAHGNEFADGVFVSWWDSLFRQLLFGDVFVVLLLAVVGLFLLVPAIYPADELQLRTRDRALTDALPRRRRAFRGRMLALRRAQRYALSVLLGLNLLLLCVNVTDLCYVWFDHAPLSAATLSRFVHEGTTALVWSILLAMVVVLFIFRGNLNFLAGTRPVRVLTYFWLAQNGLLTASVGVRNLHYIRAYGLAEGRIYVAFVLLLVLVGLYSLYRKVRDRKSVSYLLQVNGLAAYLFLIAFAGVNWAGVITRVNLRFPVERIDWTYLVEDLDGRNHFLLRRRLDDLPRRLRPRVSPPEKVPFTDWRTWNYAGARIRQ